MDSQIKESGAFVDLYSSRRFCILVMELLLSGKPFGWVTIDKPGAADVAIEDAAVAWKLYESEAWRICLKTGFIGQKGDKGMRAGTLRWCCLRCLTCARGDEGMRAGTLRCQGRGISWRQAEWNVYLCEKEIRKRQKVFHKPQDTKKNRKCLI